MDRFELYYKFAESQLLEQDRRWQSIEVKAASFMALSVALLGVAGLIMANFIGYPRNMEIQSLAIGALVLLTFCCAYGFSMGALHIRNWHVNPSLDELQQHVSNQEYTDAQIIEWTVQAMTNAYFRNNEILSNKADMARYCLIALSLEAIFIVILVATAS